MDMEIDPKLCFVLMPMRDPFIEIYEDVIKPTVEEAGLKCVYAGDMFEPKMIMEDIWDHIERARVIIADLTGRNPNVFYEVGYGHSLDKGKVILITQKIGDVPFDLRGFRCFDYKLGPRGLKGLGSKLTKAIEAILAREPGSPRVVTRTVEKTVEKRVDVPIEVPAALDDRTQEALELYKLVETVEQGQAVLSDERVARLRKVLEEGKIVELEDLPPTITVGDLEFVLIPPGEFRMGEGDESHPVYLDAFYIGKYPITNAQYKRFVEARGHRGPGHWSGSSIPRRKENHPVVNVSWYDSRAYCQWLGDETGQVVRLPTEAEWEKAARGTDGRKYPWGDGSDQSKCNTRESGIGDTTPVGKYSSKGDSPYGVADMAGNVWEWTSSLYKDYPYEPQDGREDPEAKGARVLRGGAFSDFWYRARVAYRFAVAPASFGAYFGLRVVLLRPGSP